MELVHIWIDRSIPLEAVALLDEAGIEDVIDEGWEVESQQEIEDIGLLPANRLLIPVDQISDWLRYCSEGKTSYSQGGD